jgi:hypothetical protein
MIEEEFKTAVWTAFPTIKCIDSHIMLVVLSTLVYGLLEYYRTKAHTKQPQDDK